jgi:hypothetical protein
MAVFFTAAVISGILRMKYSPLVVWNFVARRCVRATSVGPAAYGAGKVSAGRTGPA